MSATREPSQSGRRHGRRRSRMVLAALAIVSTLVVVGVGRFLDRATPAGAPVATSAAPQPPRATVPATGTASAPVSPSPSATGARVSWPLRVGNPRTHLEDATSAPFVWVADTAWDLPGRLTRPEVVDYLDRRREQDFTVIQTVAIFRPLAQAGNAYGDSPVRGSIAALQTTPGSDPGDAAAYDYWDHLDFVIAEADRRGLVVALWPIWSANHAGSTVVAGNASAYGQFLAARYRDRPVVWVLGGDHRERHGDIWRAMAAGIRSAAGPDRPLVTYHPPGAYSSVEAFPEADFHMTQSSHCVREGYVPLVRDTLAAAGGKAVLDAEALYEDHPWCWDATKGYSTADQVRAHQYWALFSGAFGATYGHHSVWQFHDPAKRSGDASARRLWRTALTAPGATQMRHVAALLRLRPLDRRIPDDAVIRSERGQGWGRVVALRDGLGRYLMAYLPRSQAIRLDLGRLAGDRVRVSWFNPRTGELADQGVRSKTNAATLTPPPAADAAATAVEHRDWVVIVDRVTATG